MNADTESYLYRYRVISEDRNQVSHWTPIQSVKVSPITQLTTDQYAIKKDATENDIDVIWTTPEYLVGVNFDIYVRWAANDDYVDELSTNGLVAYPWRFLASVSASSYGIIIPPTIKNGITGLDVAPQKALIAVQVPTFPKKRVDNATLFKSAQINI